MKTIFKLLLILACVAYLIYVAIGAFVAESDAKCISVEVVYGDTLTGGFITQDEVCKILKESKKYPVGQILDSVKGVDIEKALLKNKYIKKVSSYKKPDGVYCITLEQRVPIMRVMTEAGDDYYIDADGAVLDASKYLANVVVASGHVTKEFAQKDLVRLARFIEKQTFWKDQISQVYVTSSGKVDFYMRVGEDQVVHFGNVDDIEKKFTNLRAFYEKVQSETGWNLYSEISVDFDGQIVARRR